MTNKNKTNKQGKQMMLAQKIFQNTFTKRLHQAWKELYKHQNIFKTDAAAVVVYYDAVVLKF